MSKTQPETQELNYLRDEPCDKLTDHHIVKSLCKVLSCDCKDKENGASSGRVIGLLGSWGSGKSSIIKNVINHFEDKDKVAIIEYDSWENEKFPFKLGFLKRLLKTSTIEQKTKEALELQVKSLEQIKDTKSEVKYPLLTFPNAMLVLSLFLVTFGRGLDSEFLNFIFSRKLLFNIHLTDNVNYNIPWSWFTIGSIIIAFILLRVDWQLTKEESNKSSGGWQSCIAWILWLVGIGLFAFGVRTSNLFFITLPIWVWWVFNIRSLFYALCGVGEKPYHFLSGVSPHTESIITINKTPDPSFLDFSDLYKKIIKEYKAPKIIIVIDNIDRLEPEEAKHIWSILKGMVLKNGNSNSGDLNKEINVIIPVDEEQIANIFADNKATQDDETASFIQKTFDITFRVPPFIFSKSHEILVAKLKESGLLENNKVSINDLVSIFETRNFYNENGHDKDKPSSYSGKPTPRKIIKLINELISLEQSDIWKDIDIKVKFAFCLHYNNIANRLSQNSLTKLLPENNTLLLDILKDHNDALVALYYGVSRKNSIELVREDDISNKIELSDWKITEEPDIQEKWFNKIVNKVLNNKKDKPFDIIMNILSYLMTLHGITTELEAQSEYKKLVTTWITTLSELKALNYNLPQNTPTVLEMALKLADYQENKEKLINLLFKIEGTDNTEQNTEIWLDTFEVIKNHFKLDNKEKLDSVIPYTPDDLYRELIPLLSDEQKNEYDTYTFRVKNLKDIIESVKTKPAILYKHLDFFINSGDYPNNWKNNFTNVVIPALIENQQAFQSTNLSDYYQLCIDSIALAKKYNLAKSLATFKSLIPVTISVINDEIEGQQVAIATYFEVLEAHTLSQNAIESFTKAYLTIHNNNLLCLYNLNDSILGNKTDIINYALDKNLSTTFSDSKAFFEKFNFYYSMSSKTHTIISDVISDSKIELKNLIFTGNNSLLLYYLLKDKNNITEIKANAKTYLDKLTKENWGEQIQKGFASFGSALLLEFNNEAFRSALKETLPNFLQWNLKRLEENELKTFKKLMKTSKIIFNYLQNNHNEALAVNDKFLTTFEDSICGWLKATSKTETIFAEYVDRIEDVEWLIRNNGTILKFIATDDDKETFVAHWENDDKIKEAFADIFNDVKKMKEEEEKAKAEKIRLAKEANNSKDEIDDSTKESPKE